MMFLLGEIAVSLDNLGAETANARLSTETKITCSHVFVDEIPGTWRAGRPPKWPIFRILGPIFGLRGPYLGDETSSEKSIEPVIFGVDSKMVISAKKYFPTFFPQGYKWGRQR